MNATTWRALDLHAPVASLTGPFPLPSFLQVLSGHVVDEAEVLIGATDQGSAAFQVHDGTLMLVGPENLVDYRSPLGDPAAAIRGVVESMPTGTNLDFDSLPLEAAEVFRSALGDLGIAVEPRQHHATAVLALPESFDEYMSAIAKKERHETRRKTRRLTEALGQFEIVTLSEPGEALERFFRWHRAADGDKAAFMTEEMEELFSALVGQPGWQLDALATGDSGIVAAVVAFVDEDGYYLYNSAYDVELRHLAPGVVLLNSLIERSIESGHRVFDFLKGDEAYKFRMGAESRPLYRIEATVRPASER